MEMTMREFLEKVVELGDDDLTTYAEAQIAKLDKKNEKRKTTLTKDQKANAELKTQILELLANFGQRKANEIGGKLDISTNKASALLRQLEIEGKVISKEVKSGKSRVKGYEIVKIADDSIEDDTIDEQLKEGYKNITLFLFIIIPVCVRIVPVWYQTGIPVYKNERKIFFN